VRKDEEKHWSPKAHLERRNRWHVQSCAVHKDWQRKGIGMKIMEQVLEKAQSEGVIIGLEASAEGERLYRKCGFELLAKFTQEIEMLGQGGIMIWRPRKVNGS
jgi:GNAT superfamily N-acetyltransferase